MVKGVTRQVVVVKGTEEKLFDQAIFLVREDALTDGEITEAVMDVVMKKLSILILILLLLLTSGCVNTNITYDIVASTLPVYDFTSFICNGTPLTVGKLVTESISCLHDYSMHNKVSILMLQELPVHHPKPKLSSIWKKSE